MFTMSILFFIDALLSCSLAILNELSTYAITPSELLIVLLLVSTHYIFVFKLVLYFAK